MKHSPFAALLALAATLPLAASCQCGGDKPGGTVGGSTATESNAAGSATLSELSFKLPSGLSVDLVNGPCGDSVAIVVLFNVGIDHDPVGRCGLAQLAGRVLATTAPAGRAQRTVETGNDFTLYSVTAPADAIEAELTDIAGWMAQGAATEADLTREQDRLLVDLGKLTGADAQLTANSLAEEAVLPTRGNGKRLGIPTELKAVTHAELLAFWQTSFKAGNARIAIAGRFDVAKVRAKIEAAFGPIAAGTPPTLRDAGDATVKGTLVMGDAPKAVAIAVLAPAPTDPLFGPFLVLANRLLEKPTQPRTWDVAYDPVHRPELLLVTGPVGQAEQPEPAAGRMRTEVAALLSQPPTANEIEKARGRFRLYLEPHLLDADVCASDPSAFAVARARAGQTALKEVPTLGAVTKDQLDEAAKRFDTKATAAVIAGGTLR